MRTVSTAVGSGWDLTTGRRRSSEIGPPGEKLQPRREKSFAHRGAAPVRSGLDSAPMAERQIVGLGGGASTEEETRRLLEHVVGLAGESSPRVCLVPTAVGDDADTVLRIYGLLPPQARTSYVPFFPWPPRDLRAIALDQDVIFIGGGNTANALAIWRVHGFDEILREAWEAGVVMTGWSAGMICWFEAGGADSYGPPPGGVRGGRGLFGGG